MPILVRPIREQLEHDRVIRQLQTRWRRRYDVAINVGEEQTNQLRVGSTIVYPDLILTAQGRSRRVEAVVEVETGESVNHLEALAQWAHMARTRAPLHLYVPSSSVEAARRLCTEHQIGAGEIWSYHAIGDQTRFALVHRLKAASVPARANKAAGQKRTAGSRVPKRVLGATRPKAKSSRARPAATRATRATTATKAVKASKTLKAAKGAKGRKEKSIRRGK